MYIHIYKDKKIKELQKHDLEKMNMTIHNVQQKALITKYQMFFIKYLKYLFALFTGQ